MPGEAPHACASVHECPPSLKARIAGRVPVPRLPLSRVRTASFRRFLPEPRRQARRRFWPTWEQGSHRGDIARAVESGRLRREDVAELGRVLGGDERGRRSEDEITVFDSTGLAVQDLAVALAVYERYEREPSAEAFADVVQMEVG